MRHGPLKENGPYFRTGPTWELIHLLVQVQFLVLLKKKVQFLVQAGQYLLQDDTTVAVTKKKRYNSSGSDHPSPRKLLTAERLWLSKAWDARRRPTGSPPLFSLVSHPALRLMMIASFFFCELRYHILICLLIDDCFIALEPVWRSPTRSSASKFGDHFAGSAIFAEIRFVVAMIAQPTTMDIVYEIISFSSPAFQFFSY